MPFDPSLLVLLFFSLSYVVHLYWTTTTTAAITNLSLSISVSMTPAYLNLPSSLCPVAEQREDDHQHLKLFIPSSYQASSSLSCHTFFDGNKDERGRGISVFEGSLQQHDHHEKAHQLIGSSSCDHPQAFPSPSFQSTVYQEDCKNPDKLSLSCQRDQEAGRDHGSKNAAINGPVQWMSSKMRFMQKMVDPNFPATNRPVRSTKKLQNNQQQQQHGIFEMSSSLHNSNNVNAAAAARVCADCSTTTTPLWRSGPRGPKSLCNACGIRQRKARRAIAEASAAATNHGLVVATDNNISSSVKSSSSSTSSTIKVQNKEKKLRTSCHFAQYKNKYCKLSTTDDSNSLHDDHNIMIERPPTKQLSFKDFALSLRNNPAFERVFPKDETEAAILLMELSCGLVHS